jgi:hypothetical protein
MNREGWIFIGFVGASALAINAMPWLWTACRNPAWATVLNGAQSCPEFWLNRYQGLIGALVALGAAFVAVRPVWRQLAEMKRQADHTKYEQMRKRSLELNAERNLIYQITSASQNVAEALVAFGENRKILDRGVAPGTPGYGLQPQELDLLQNQQRYFDQVVVKLASEIGPLWGSVDLQTHRQTCVEAAQRFSVALTEYINTLTLGGPVSVAALDAAAVGLATDKRVLFQSATAVHQQIEVERKRLGRLIAETEKSLFE